MNKDFIAGEHDENNLNELLRLLSDKVDPALVTLLIEHGKRFLEQVGSSAPRPSSQVKRWQDKVIVESIPFSSSVLDLGCGEGELLSWLCEVNKSRVQGVEIDAEKVAICVERGVPVIQADLDSGLKGFPDKSFDYVILEETLQTLKKPDSVLQEILRVGKCGIVSFPNFACWRVRLDLAVRGRMPVTDWLPYRWYDTPNIHLFSLLDFIEHTSDLNMTIVSIYVLDNGLVRSFKPGDNLYAEEVLIIFKSD